MRIILILILFPLSTISMQKRPSSQEQKNIKRARFSRTAPEKSLMGHCFQATVAGSDSDQDHYAHLHLFNQQIHTLENPNIRDTITLKTLPHILHNRPAHLYAFVHKYNNQIDFNTRDKHGNTPLITALCELGRLYSPFVLPIEDVLDIFIKVSNINLTNVRGETALHRAAFLTPPVIQKLLKKRATCGHDKRGLTALDNAAAAARYDNMYTLLPHYESPLVKNTVCHLKKQHIMTEKEDIQSIYDNPPFAPHEREEEKIARQNPCIFADNLRYARYIQNFPGWILQDPRPEYKKIARALISYNFMIHSLYGKGTLTPYNPQQPVIFLPPEIRTVIAQEAIQQELGHDYFCKIPSNLEPAPLRIA